MINPKELRIENLLEVDGRISIVQGIGVDYIYTTIEIGLPVDRCIVSYKNLNPIPLTSEWLVKFGFKKHAGIIIDPYSIKLPLIGCKELSVTIGKGNQYIYIKDYNSDADKTPTDLVCIRNSDSHGDFHVHQLQNLYFALTGEELEIKQEA